HLHLFLSTISSDPTESAWRPAYLPIPAIDRTPTGKAQPTSDPFRRRARLDRPERGKHSAPAPAEGGEPGSSQGIDDRRRPVDRDRAALPGSVPSCHQMPGISVSTKGSMATARKSSER